MAQSRALQEHIIIFNLLQEHMAQSRALPREPRSPGGRSPGGRRSRSAGSPRSPRSPGGRSPTGSPNRRQYGGSPRAGGGSPTTASPAAQPTFAAVFHQPVGEPVVRNLATIRSDVVWWYYIGVNYYQPGVWEPVVRDYLVVLSAMCMIHQTAAAGGGSYNCK